MTTEELSRFTPEEKRIRIAELCGWKTAPTYQGWYPPEELPPYHEPAIRLLHELPDYLNDLNAIHEAEKVLIAPANCVAWDRYRQVLQEIAGHLMTHATAAQRADAFLLTLA